MTYSMKERISRDGGRRVYQPQIRESRVHDLYVMKVVTRKPMTVLLDEALSIYLATFFSSDDYKAYADAQWRAEEEWDNNPEEPPDCTPMYD